MAVGGESTAVGEFRLAGGKQPPDLMQVKYQVPRVNHALPMHQHTDMPSVDIRDARPQAGGGGGLRFVEVKRCIPGHFLGRALGVCGSRAGAHADRVFKPSPTAHQRTTGSVKHSAGVQGCSQRAVGVRESTNGGHRPQTLWHTSTTQEPLCTSTC